MILIFHYPWKYKGYCADSGYDSYANHQMLKELGIKNYIKPNNYELSKKRKFKKDIGLHQNMQYNEKEDYFLCKAGKKLKVVGFSSSKRKYGVQTKVTIYKCVRGCVSCKFRKECMKRSRGKYKSLHVDRQFYDFQQENLKNITTDFGSETRVNRSIQADGVFAQIKSNLAFNRFKSFGKQRTTTEWILMCFAMNSIRLAARSDQALIGKPFWHSLLDSEVS
ncbi:MAG: transposase [Sphaerochaetaceae bacterium]